MSFMPFVATALTLGSVVLAPVAEAQRRGGGHPDARYERPGADRRSDRRCRNSAAGTLLGALAGGLLGRSVVGRGDRAGGIVLGAGAGALAGHAIEKSGNPGYCR